MSTTYSSARLGGLFASGGDPRKNKINAKGFIVGTRVKSNEKLNPGTEM
jgi:hypothetical protein